MERVIQWDPDHTPMARLRASLPPVYDEDTYRALYPDLARKTAKELRVHREKHGVREGRRANVLRDRTAFVQLVRRDVDVLELEPNAKPLRSGDRVRYFHRMERAALVARAGASGAAAPAVPHIHFVSPTRDLAVVDRRFDVVLGDGVLGRQPDLIGFLRSIERILHPRGLCFLLVPDRRYGRDRFQSDTTIADILDAHHERRTEHTLRTVLAHAALTTHDDPRRHWNGDHGTMGEVRRRLAAALERRHGDFEPDPDAHAWYFTPETFRASIEMLRALRCTRLDPIRIYPTLRDSGEFWVVLERPDDDHPIGNLESLAGPVADVRAKSRRGRAWLEGSRAAIASVLRGLGRSRP